MTNPTFQELLTSQEARFTNEQLEAWAGLEPWEAHETTWGVWDVVEIHTANADCDDDPIAHLYKVYPWPEGAAAEAFRNDQTNAALIAAAPTLAAALLAERKAREVEVAKLKEAMAAKEWPPSNAELREMLAVIVGAWWSESSAWRLRTRQLNPEDIKGMYAIRDVLAPYIARQALKGQRDDQAT